MAEFVLISFFCGFQVRPDHNPKYHGQLIPKWLFSLNTPDLIGMWNSCISKSKSKLKLVFFKQNM